MSLKPASHYLRHAGVLRDNAAQSADAPTKAHFVHLAEQYEKQAAIAVRFEPE